MNASRPICKAQYADAARRHLSLGARCGRWLPLWLALVMLTTGCGKRRSPPPPALLPDPVGGRASTPIHLEPLKSMPENGTPEELTVAQRLAARADKTSTRNRPRARNTPHRGHTGRADLLARLSDLESLPNGQKRMQALLALGKMLGSEHFENALALAGAVSNPSTRNLLYQGIFAVQAARDPRAALQAAQQLAPGLMRTGSSSTYRERQRDHETAVIAALRELARVAPAEAIAFLDRSDARLRGRARHVVYEGWGHYDHEAALARLTTLPEKDQAALVPAVFLGWAQTDAAAAAAYADGLEDGSIKNRIIKNIAQGVLSTWDPENPAERANWAVTALPESAQQAVLTQVYNRWAQADPAAAATHLLASRAGTGESGTAMLSAITRQWAQRDPDAALAWVDKTFTDDAAYVALVQSVTHGVRYKNPAKAAELLQKIPFTYGPDSVGASEVQGLMAFWSRKDSGAAIAWTDSLEDRPLRIVATKTLASSMASKDFNKAMDWAGGIDDPDMQAYALSNIALKQSMQGMQKSDAWIETLPEGFIRTRTAAGYALGALWRAKDNGAAAQVKAQLSQDALAPADLVRIIGDSKLDPGSKDRLIELLQ